MDQLRVVLRSLGLSSSCKNSLFSSPNSSCAGPHTPSYTEVCIARAILKSQKLPTELVLQILDLAHYWPERTFHSVAAVEAQVYFRATSIAKLCLDARLFEGSLGYMFGGEKVKPREIEFEVISRDQGWTSQGTDGTFHTSSWLEVSILRRQNDYQSSPDEPYSAPLEMVTNRKWRDPGEVQSVIENRGWTLVRRPDTAYHYPQESEHSIAWYLQGNRVADPSLGIHNIVWSEDSFQGDEGAGKGEGFIDALKDGDHVLVWARAKWAGWACHVDRVKMTVRYGFY
ncbi:hypothetical protein CC78DRAFT_587047 [Lojkania enalia]|uniref:Uncharacterized protein n=1 Tax=Lojkania enalia TaxID=147567 RepID=A0A9P4JZ85_9PLEO|nr:hypothetical protein CC78DRAFT_587047 [Didymosphaeria enalia]